MAFQKYCARYGKDPALLAAGPVAIRKHAQLNPLAQASADLDLRRADPRVQAAAARWRCRRPPSPTSGPTLAQLPVAELTAALVPTTPVRLGVGVVPAHVAARLTEPGDLGLHLGVLPGQVQPRLASGAVTGRRRNVDAGRHGATGLLGGDPRGWGRQVLLQPLSHMHTRAPCSAARNSGLTTRPTRST